MSTLVKPENAALIDSVLTAKVQERQLFTAWNVTADAKRRGATQYHNDMKGLVHVAYDDGTLTALNYGRTPIPTPTGEAYLYHPLDADTATIQQFIDHINSHPAPSVPPAPEAATATASMTVAPPDPNAATSAAGAKTQSVDAEGRLPLYADTLRDIGAQPGGIVLVFSKKGEAKLTVCVPDNKGSQPDHTYIVNKDGRVRISATLLLDLSSTTGAYQVEVKGDSPKVIEITNS